MSLAVTGTNSIAIERNCVSLPAWFPADKAAAVLRHQKKQFALLADQQGVTRVASLDQLTHAPATKSVLWCGRPLGPAVAPATSPEEALRLLDAHPEAFLPVVLGGVVLGILTRAALPSVSRFPVHAPAAAHPAPLSLAA
ncbi:MAG TPA: hypothetical protein VHU40_01815 [Polyangia bacterium]|nr:hypothetical protein [Polyangia bacterium]